MRLTEFKNEYWWPLVESKLRECTLVGYESVWRNHIAEPLGDLELEELTPRKIDAWLESMPPKTARKSLAILRTCIRTAYKYEFIDKDPTTRLLKVPPKERSTQPTLTRAEVEILIEGFKNNELEAWVICMVTLGLRREEGCALLWSDINLDSGAVSITKGAQWVNGRTVINPPKTRNGYRTVYLSGDNLECVRRVQKPQPCITPYNPSVTAQRYKRYCNRQSLPYVPPKNLRTTFGTLAVQDGWDVARISKWMGHYDPSVTMSNYMHPKDEDVAKLSGMWERRQSAFRRATRKLREAFGRKDV